MIIVRRRDPSFSGYSDVHVIVNGNEVTKVGYNGEKQFQLQPGIHSIYFKRALAGKSNSLTLDVKSENDVFVVECSFNKMASAISANIVSVQREVETQVQSSPASADEIMKFKELLDNGIISQDEFDTAKKRLLGDGTSSASRLQTEYSVESKAQPQKAKRGGCITAIAVIIGLLLLFWAIGNIGGLGTTECRQLSTAKATAKAHADDKVFVDNLWVGFWATHNQCPICKKNGDIPAAYR